MGINVGGYKVTFIFDDGTTSVIDVDKNNLTGSPSNYITTMEIKEIVSTQNHNPVGVVTCGTAKIVLTSLNREYAPENKDSPHYGKMGNNARIQIELKVADEGTLVWETVKFSTIYVSSWVASTGSGNKYQVVIEGTDLLGIVTKNSMPDIEIRRNVDIRTGILEDISYKLNKENASKYKFMFSRDGELPYKLATTNDLEVNDIDTLLNIVGQSCLLNFYIDRDSSLTDTKIQVMDVKQPKGVIVGLKLSDEREITYASIDRGALVNYTGVKVNYSLGSVNKEGELVTLNNITLVPGENRIENIEFSSGVYKVTMVQVDCNEQDNVDILSFRYSRRRGTLIINNPTINDIECSIVIKGQTINENKMAVIRKLDINSNETLEVTNNLLREVDVVRYSKDLLDVIKDGTDTVIVKGMFDPRKIRLNKLVDLGCSKSIHLEGIYRIKELNWTLGATLKCEAKLMG